MKHVPLRRFSREAFEKAKAMSAPGTGEQQSEYKLPHARVFHQMVETCFWSSLQQEERRNQKFKFFYCDLPLIDKLQSDSQNFGGYFQFKKRIEFSPDEVQKIAGAMNFW